jgi:hypothetical protein
MTELGAIKKVAFHIYIKSMTYKREKQRERWGRNRENNFNFDDTFLRKKMTLFFFKEPRY